MKKKLILLLSFVLLLSITISIFAVTSNENYFKTTPADLGTQLSVNGPTITTYNTLTKTYLVINGDNIHTTDISALVFYGADNYEYHTIGYVIVTDEYIQLQLVYLAESDYGFIMMPTYRIDNSGGTYYIPIFTMNIYTYVLASEAQYYSVYSSTETNINNLYQQYFDMGYSNGYNIGVDDGIALGQALEPELDLVGHVEQLMGTFVGQNNARYIVPIALVLIILFVYFLFIRWLLTLINSKNVTKVSDICVCAACLIILIVMYAPMLDLTIKSETVTQVETTEAVIENNREVIHVSEYVKYHTETGDIWTLKGVDPPELYSVESDVKVKEVKNEETTIS